MSDLDITERLRHSSMGSNFSDGSYRAEVAGRAATLIESLRAEADHLNKIIDKREYHITMLILKVAKAKERIEELESRDIGEDIQAFNRAHGIYEITTDQIDAAWEYAQKEDTTQAEAEECLSLLGIVACEECGGSGESPQTPKNPPMIDPCPSCHGHGWRKK